MKTKNSIIIATIFILVFLGHFSFFVLSKTVFSPWVVNNSQIYSIIQGYFEQQEYFMGFSYALAVAFTVFSILNYVAGRKKNAVGAVGGMAITGFLYFASCFLIGCCGSPMLVVYLSLFGSRFLGFTKPLIALVTIVSVGISYYWIKNKNNSCASCSNSSKY